MDADGDDEDGEEAEEDDGVDEDGDGAGGHVAELQHPRPRRQLEQQARRQHHEQDHRHDDRAPVRARPAVHLSLLRADSLSAAAYTHLARNPHNLGSSIDRSISLYCSYLAISIYGLSEARTMRHAGENYVVMRLLSDWCPWRRWMGGKEGMHALLVGEARAKGIEPGQAGIYRRYCCFRLYSLKRAPERFALLAPKEGKYKI